MMLPFEQSKKTCPTSRLTDRDGDDILDWVFGNEDHISDIEPSDTESETAHED